MEEVFLTSRVPLPIQTQPQPANSLRRESSRPPAGNFSSSTKGVCGISCRWIDWPHHKPTARWPESGARRCASRRPSAPQPDIRSSAAVESGFGRLRPRSNIVATKRALRLGGSYAQTVHSPRAGTANTLDLPPRSPVVRREPGGALRIGPA
jgi:hypothetical protein